MAKRTVYLGGTYKGATITNKKPKTAIKLGESTSFNRYCVGTKEYIIPKKDVKVIRYPYPRGNKHSTNALSKN